MGCDESGSRGFYYGASLVYPGSGDYLYGFIGAGTPNFYRYSISGNSWIAMPLAPGTINAGALVYPGSGAYIYGLGGMKQRTFTVVFFSRIVPQARMNPRPWTWARGPSPGYTTLVFNPDLTAQALYLEGDGYPPGVAVEEWTIQQNAVNATTCNTTNRICNSLASWEDTADGTGARDLVAENKIAVAKIDGAWTAADTTAVAPSTAGQRTRRVTSKFTQRRQQGIRGKWDDTKYRLIEAGGNYNGITIVNLM